MLRRGAQNKTQELKLGLKWDPRTHPNHGSHSPGWVWPPRAVERICGAKQSPEQASPQPLSLTPPDAAGLDPGQASCALHPHPGAHCRLAHCCPAPVTSCADNGFPAWGLSLWGQGGWTLRNLVDPRTPSSFFYPTHLLCPPTPEHSDPIWWDPVFGLTVESPLQLTTNQ